MRVLMVYPEFPVTYWGFQYGLSIVGKRASLPPLGLVTVAALLPPGWDIRLIDLNVESLDDVQLRWADAVLTGGMRIQIPSTRQVIDRARALGKRVVVGGPAVSTDPDLHPEADVRFVGEVEGQEAALAEAIAGTRTAVMLERGEFPPIESSPVPRFDLLDLDHYSAMSIQYSRGCPFRCEFCDIIKVFGRRPRVKSPEQVLREMQRLYDLGHHGSVFFVDDNFIGNQREVRELLPRVAAWQRQHGYPFVLSTEASVNLADRPSLVEGMVEAGFSSVFLGIESPSGEALRDARKTQNLNRGLLDAVEAISRHGIEVMGGFIVGFDSDTPEIFDAQRGLIQGSPIPLAMVGLLMALPRTDLWDRLEREGRLRPTGSGEDGDQFGRPNFVPRMDEITLLKGYAELLRSLYDADAYYDRVERFLDLCVPLPGGGRRVRPSEAGVVARVVSRVGLQSRRRRRFWRLVRRAARHHPHRLAWSIARAVVGEHMIRYTDEVVLPKLSREIAALQVAAPASPHPRREAAPSQCR